MNLRHLRAFIATAEELSFTGASRRLNIAQPPLSRHVQRLERDTGVTLFVRHRRGVELTADGRKLLKQAKRVNRAAEAFLEHARRAKKGKR